MLFNLVYADTAEGNWRLVLTKYPMKELVRKHVAGFAMLMSYSEREDRR